MAEKTSEPSKLARWCTKYYWWLLAGLLLWLVFLCFFKLGTAPLNSSDEGRHGVNAYEMQRRGEYLVNYYNGEPDYWNFKPPLSFYVIMLGYRLFGYNAWGLRCFMALISVITVVIIALFMKKQVNATASLLSVLMLMSCYYFFLAHYMRAGDADALFLLLINVGIISLYLSSQQSNWLHVTALCFALAFLTKSFHALVLAPIVFFYLLTTHGFKRLKWWQYVTLPTLALAPIIIWAVARFQFDGWTFLKEMLFYDVLKRSGVAIESHDGGPFYYLYYLICGQPMVFMAILFLLWRVIGKWRHRQPLTNWEKLALITWLSVALIYEIARTKLAWYIYPMSGTLIMYGASELALIIERLDPAAAGRMVMLYFSMIIIVIGVGFSTFFVLTSEQAAWYDDKTMQIELQGVVKQLTATPTPGATYFFQGEKITFFDRALLLLLEWNTDQLLDQGGVNGFNQAQNAYLILNREYWDESVLTEPENCVFCFASERYAVYYRA